MSDIAKVYVGNVDPELFRLNRIEVTVSSGAGVWVKATCKDTFLESAHFGPWVSHLRQILEEAQEVDPA